MLQNIFTFLTWWIADHGEKLFVIFLVTLITILLNRFLTPVIIRKIVRTSPDVPALEEKKREDTLISVLRSLILFFILIAALMMLLSEIGVNIGPIIAAAGIAGVALGFGGQYLIKDLLSGLFVVFENQYRVGDYVSFSALSVEGVVEKIGLRATVLRDFKGAVHHVPNGEVRVASNLSKTFSRVNFDLPVAYNVDIEQAITIINTVGKELAKDPEWEEKILTPVRFRRVEEFADHAINLRVTGDVLPRQQWEVAGEFRKRIKKAFDKEGIVIPYPQMVVHQGSTSKQ